MVSQVRLAQDVRGLGAVEFALLAPILFLFVIGIAELGTLFFANSGLKAAVGEGARFATIYPRPSEAQILAVVNDRRFGLDPKHIIAPTATPCVVGTRQCIDLQMGYKVPMNFIFMKTPPITLTERRRAYVHDTVPAAVVTP